MNKKWAVAIVEYHGWEHDSAIGDGITRALHSLVSRHDTKLDAEREAARLNDAQPAVLPGSPDVPVYEARPYRMDDYLSRQARENGRRQSDVRTAI